MYPNPQAALPLPSRPNLDHYKKRAEDLVQACRSRAPDAVRAWATCWNELEREADQIVPFAQSRLEDGACSLGDAEFVIARVFGFASWPAFAAHVESLGRASSPVSVFEAAVDAIVAGDAAALGRLLQEHPDLVRARSTRE